MRGRVTDKSSILLLGRNTVIIGAIVITVMSLGIGYFLGYKGGNFGLTEKQDQNSAETKLPLPAEEKRVLETPPGDRPVLPSPSKQPVSPTENDAQKTAEQAQIPQDKEDTKSKKILEPSTKAVVPEPAVKGKKEKADSGESAQPEKKENVAAAKTDKKAARDKTTAQNSAKGEPKTKVRKDDSKSEPGAKAYTVQVGAFPSSEGASQLQQSLKAKGIKAYIANRAEGDPYYRVRIGTYKNKKEAERTAIALQKRTGLPNFVTIK